MATIPLPALHTAPIQPPESPLENFARAMGIKNAQQEMQQRQVMAPLQEQAAQQSVQAGEMQNQLMQQQLQDQQTFRQAMQDPSNQGKTIGDLADTLAAKGGISPQSWQAMKKMDIDQRTALAGLDEKSLANLKAAHTATQELYNNLMDMPDEQLAQNWPAIAQQYDAIPGNNKTPLNPQQPMTKQQLQQFGPMLSMSNTYISDALARQKSAADAQAAQVRLQGEQNAAAFYAQNGGAPGISPELMQQSDWLKQNPGKGPSDYAIAMKKIVPAYNFNLQQGAAAGSSGAPAANGMPLDWKSVAQRYGMTPTAFDQAAEKYYSTGVLPPIGRNANAIAMNRDLMNRAAELHPNASLAENSAEYKANENSLKSLQTNFDQVNAFEQTAEKNMNLLQSIAQNVPDLGIKYGNVPVRMITDRMIGTDNMAAFKTALATAQTEAAKVLNSSNASGVLSDSARHELQDVINGDAPYSALVASLNTLKQDMQNRRQAYQSQLQDIQGRLRGSAATQQNGGAASMVTVQVRGHAPGQIPASALQKFKQDHPDAQVIQ